MSRIGFRGVVLDLDGTLLDTVPDARAALNRVFGSEGLRPLSMDEVLTTVGEGVRTMLSRALTLHGRTADDGAVDRYVGVYMDAYLSDPTGHTVIYPGVRETVDLLRDAGAVLGVCTNKPRLSTHAVLDRLFPERPFAAVVCPEDVAYRKPDGRHVLATMEKMNVAPAQCVMVGDSETDIAAAIDAGIPAVAVSYGYTHVPLETLGVAAIVDRFADLPAVLRTLAAERRLA